MSQHGFRARYFGTCKLQGAEAHCFHGPLLLIQLGEAEPPQPSALADRRRHLGAGENDILKPAQGKAGGQSNRMVHF